METGAAKSLFAVVLGVFAYLRGALNELLVVLAMFMLADYVIGVTSALLQGAFTVRKGISGAVKKACYLLLVLIGFLLDYAIGYIGAHTGIQIETSGMFGYTIMCYLIGTEGLSCLRGLGRMGLRVPKFFLKGFGLLQSAADPEAAADGQQDGREGQ